MRPTNTNDEAQASFPGSIAGGDDGMQSAADGDDTPSLKSTKHANHGSPVSKKNVVLVQAIRKIESIKCHAPEFRNAQELKAAFEEADKEVKTKGAAAIDGQADVILALAKVQAILSQRGKEKMRGDAGINQSWSEYYAWFQKRFNYDLTLRAVQYKIAELAGKKRERKCSECHKTNGHAASCSKYKEPHLTQLEAKLIDATSRAHEIVKAVKQGGNVDEVIADFEKNAPTPEKLVEHAERPVKPSLAGSITQPSKQPSNGMDYRRMLIDLLDQIERLGSHVPVELHMACKVYRSTIGLPPNVGSKTKKSAGEQISAPQLKPETIPTTIAKRFHWVERTIGDLKELIILDGNNVYDCYPLEDIKEVQAEIEKLNMTTVEEAPRESAH
jgi:hypothetical protein